MFYLFLIVVMILMFRAFDGLLGASMTLLGNHVIAKREAAKELKGESLRGEK